MVLFSNEIQFGTIIAANVNAVAPRKPIKAALKIILRVNMPV